MEPTEALVAMAHSYQTFEQLDLCLFMKSVEMGCLDSKRK